MGHLNSKPLAPFPEKVDSLYGPFPAGVTFLHRSFRDAIAEASRQHKFLLVYIHSEQHPNTSGFLQNVLKDGTLASYLCDHFVLWGSDVIAPEGMKCLTQLGGTTFPFLAVILRAASRDQAVLKCQGSLTPDILLSALTRCVSDNGAAFIASRADAAEAAQRQALRDMQAEELQQALRADQEREQRAREQQEVEEALRREEEKKAREAADALERQRMEAEEAAHGLLEAKALAISRLKEEPPVGESGAIMTRIFLLNGSFVERRFRETDTVMDIADFVLSLEAHQGGDSTCFEIITKAPVKKLPYEATLKALGLPGRVVLGVRSV